MIVSIAVLLLVGCSLAYPRTYQEQRQTFYTQPIPVHQRLAAAPQLYYQQQPILQVPAATSLLPNNVNSGVRYGQQQVLYVVPSGSQVYYEEGAEGEESGGSLYNLFNGLVSYFPFQSGEKPAEGGGAEGEAKPEKTEEKPEKPEKLEQSAGSENLIGASEHLQQGIQAQQVLHPQPLQFQAQKQHHQQLLQQQQQQQQQALEKYLALRNQFVANTPALGLPSSNLLYYKNVAQLADYNTKPGSAAIAFQRHLSKKGHENHVQTTTEKEENENEESGSDGESTNEELGPSIAQAKPQAVSVAGPGGVAAAAPIGTAIVGPGGMALSAPQATAVAGTKTKPGSNEKIRTYFPKNSAAASFYPY